MSLIVASDLTARELAVRVVRLEGAVGVAVAPGVADMEQAGLQRVGEPLLQSEGVLVGCGTNTAVGAMVERRRAN